MKHRLLLVLALFLLIAALIGLNAVNYVQKEKVPDSEAVPNRSTFNSGPTGTRALFDLLSETGHKTVRWRDQLTRDFRFDPADIGTFVVVGKTRRELSAEEIVHLLDWVSAGGKLVIVDREPNTDLLVTSAAWQITVGEGEGSLSGSEKEYLVFSVDPGDQKQMTARTNAARPLQPASMTAQVNAVQPSKFASSVTISRVATDSSQNIPVDRDSTENAIRSHRGGEQRQALPDSSPTPPVEGEMASAPPRPLEEPRPIRVPNANSNISTNSPDPTLETTELVSTDYAPVVYLSNNANNLLVDFPFGAGRIVLLTDPYVLSNGGIDLVDNAQLGINILSTSTGAIAFDEYHQGFGNDENRLLAYFSGTPAVAIFLQIAALVGLVFWSRGRRFARALPQAAPDRLSKLEYVAAMAQLQKRTKAFDLAMENVYTEFRRRASRFFGVDSYTVTIERLAGLVAERLGRSQEEVAQLLAKCEDIMHGEPTGRKELLNLIGRLRKIEAEMGLMRNRP